ncbi:MAG: hypothetical protein WC071_12260, partial [Victivallaceae bacterium]
CLSYKLGTYFVEKLNWEKCGHCSVCLQGQAKIERGMTLKPLSEHDFHELTGRFIEKLPTEVSAELITRFLCGITVPLLSRIKAKQLPGFGALEKYRYADIRVWTQSCLK